MSNLLVLLLMGASLIQPLPFCKCSKAAQVTHKRKRDTASELIVNLDASNPRKGQKIDTSLTVFEPGTNAFVVVLVSTG